jgi:hypothetical protein
VVLEVLRQVLSVVQTLFQLGMRDVAGDHEGTIERKTCRHRMAAELAQGLGHGPCEVDLDNLAAQLLICDLGKVLGRILFQALEKETVAVDLGEGLAIGRAGDPEADRTGGAMAWEAYYANVVSEVLAAELGAQTRPPAELEDLLLQFQVPKRSTELVALGG